MHYGMVFAGVCTLRMEMDMDVIVSYQAHTTFAIKVLLYAIYVPRVRD